MNARARRFGFTLIEIIVVIVLLGIIGTAFGKFILPAFQNYQSVARRAELVDAAESALRRMARDIRISLPNSVRVIDSGTNTGFALEMVPTFDGGRYCVNATGNCTGAVQVLDFTTADADFDILGCFHNPTLVALAAAAGGAGTASTAYRLAIGNAGNEVYSGGPPAVITASGGTITFSHSTGGGVGAGTCGASSGGSNTFRHHIAIGGGFAFGAASARKRVFVVETASAPVSYVCNTATGKLTRYAGYTFAIGQPNPPAVPGALVANDVTGCQISTTTSIVQTVGMVTIDLTISSSGETIRLIQQVQLDNSI